MGSVAASKHSVSHFSNVVLLYEIWLFELLTSTAVIKCSIYDIGPVCVLYFFISKFL